MKPVTYYLALSSPFTYLGHGRFEATACRLEAAVAHKPIDTHAVFSVSGGLPVKQRPAQRQAYRLAELRRWRTYVGLPLNLEPRYFPVDGEPAALLVIAAQQAGADPGPLIGAVLRAVWAEERNIADEDTLRAIATRAGHDAEALLARSRGPEARAAYEANTQEAIERGVFGVPTWQVDGELFWGQDRLNFVERALKRG